MGRNDERQDGMLSENAVAVQGAAARLADAAMAGRSEALLSALLDQLEAVAGLSRATLWARADAESAFGGGPTPWMQLRSRGAVTPAPDGAGSSYRVLEGLALGALVYEAEPFDDGGREAREEAAEALFLCADVLAAADPDLGRPAEPPPPFPTGDPGDASGRAA